MRRQPSFTRADRLEHLMADEVERLLSYEVRSPLAQQIKVVMVRLSPDLGHLRVQYVLHSGEEPGKAMLEMLELAKVFLSRALTEALLLRKKPTLVFHFDRDAMRLHRVEALLAADRARLAVVPAETQTAPDAATGESAVAGESAGEVESEAAPSEPPSV